MAKLTRKLLKLFGASGDVNDFGVFGSATTATLQKSKDIEAIQSLPSWDSGLASAVIAGNHAPYLHDMNSLFHVLSYQQAYHLQEGVAEYDHGTTYYQNSIVKKPGTLELYASHTDDNTGNALPSQMDNANWKYLGDLSSSFTPRGGIIMWSGLVANIPLGWALCDGTNKTPDLRDRFILGVSAGENPGAAGGASSATLTVANQPSHTHAINHTHDTATTSTNGEHTHDILRDGTTFGGGNTNAQRVIPGAAWIITNCMTKSGNHSHSVNIPTFAGASGSSGSATPFSIMPPYYKLAFIMKL